MHIFVCFSVTDAAFPHIDPDRLQFFEYESFSLNCAGLHGPTEWSVMTKVPSNTSQWETSTGSVKIKLAFVSHSGAYWCENRSGERTDSVNITVTGMFEGSPGWSPCVTPQLISTSG